MDVAEAAKQTELAGPADKLALLERVGVGPRGEQEGVDIRIDVLLAELVLQRVLTQDVKQGLLLDARAGVDKALGDEGPCDGDELGRMALGETAAGGGDDGLPTTVAETHHVGAEGEMLCLDPVATLALLGGGWYSEKL